MDRRSMLKLLVGGGLALGGAGALAGVVGSGLRGVESVAGASDAHEAMFYDKLPGGNVQCRLCPRGCAVGDGGRGVCGVRENRGGTYYTLVYGTAAAVNIDPIEKKPLFHYLPGSRAFSVGTVGCNMRCKDCQNWEISQIRPEQLDRPIPLSPETLVSKAREYDCEAVAFTYNEPTIFYEYMLDTAKLARQQGLKPVMISNGYINREPMLKLAPHLGAIKVDLKGFTTDFYNNYTGGTLEPVKMTIKRVQALGKWLEIVYLVVPTVNDDLDTIREMARWLKRAVGRGVPLHFSRFHPAYQLTKLPSTPVSTLEECRNAAREEGLDYVYLGNVPGHAGENTYCASCGEVVVRRYGFQVRETHVKPNGACRFCGNKIPGVWS
ncbi:MAG: AmmeMemoRadiSam system radical SAM enzyme [Armatimonadota bacterium]|nr:AmmeMemoRadiSam system radical SAM enzyme [Armatimonadota bacterium]